MNHSVELLTYADRLGGGLHELQDLLDGPLRAFGGVHVLPFFTPFDGADTGFDPIDHASVDPRLGTWEDIRALSHERELTADLIVNHMSAESVEFSDWLANGAGSPYDGMFLTFDRVFPGGGTEQQITAMYRPREGLPFTAYRGRDGSRHLVWTTFMPSQVDLDVSDPVAGAYLRRVMGALAAGGVRTVRLDALGYAVKTAGTDSFMTEQTLGFVREITAMAHDLDLKVLVEVHAHISQQQAVAPLVDLVYDFALAPVLLHSIGTGTVDRLAQWLCIRPDNSVVVLDTHDGIGLIDAGPSGVLPGLLSQSELAAVFDRADLATGGHARVASVTPAWAPMPHQINATFFSALGCDVPSYLLTRAVQMFLPGHPQIYYVGLLAGTDDHELFRTTGNGRDVNRHAFTQVEVAAALAAETTQAILGLVRLRTSHPAFDGEFGHHVLGPDSIELTWTNGRHTVRLVVSTTIGDPKFELTASGAGTRGPIGTAAGLAVLA